MVENYSIKNFFCLRKPDFKKFQKKSFFFKSTKKSIFPQKNKPHP